MSLYDSYRFPDDDPAISSFFGDEAAERVELVGDREPASGRSLPRGRHGTEDEDGTEKGQGRQKRQRKGWKGEEF